VAFKPKDRLESLRSASGLVLELAGGFELPAVDARKVERYAHHLLRAYRVRGEWFDVSPEMAIEAIEKAIRDVASGEIREILPRWIPRQSLLSNIGLSPVSAALRKARIEAGLSLRQVSEGLGISQAFLSDIEHGRRELHEKHYETLPDQIRKAVVEAAIGEIEERIRELERLEEIGKGQKSG
jgi:hypothetical protein